MAKKIQEQGSNKQQERQSPTEAANPNKTKTKDKRKDSQNSSTNGSGNKNIFVRIGSTLWDKDNQPQFQNIITLIALGVAIWLAIVTYQVFEVAAGQSESVIKAGNASEKSAIIAKQTLDSTISFQKQSDISDAKKLKRDIDFINKQKAGIDAQIKAFQETQKNFEIANRPFISVGEMSCEGVTIEKPIACTAYAVNAGRQPAYIIKWAYDWSISIDTNYKDLTNIHPYEMMQSKIIIAGSGYKLTGHTTTPVTGLDVENFGLKKKYVYFRGIIFYRGFVSKKIYSTKFVYRMILNGSPQVETKTTLLDIQ
jgi:hypothetical protein